MSGMFEITKNTTNYCLPRHLKYNEIMSPGSPENEKFSIDKLGWESVNFQSQHTAETWNRITHD